MSILKSSVESLNYLQFQFTTVFGDLKAVEFPSKIWEDMKNGTGVDGSSLGFLTTEQSDMRIKPDFDTFNIIPWDPGVGRIICDVTDNESTPHELCPRNLLKKTVKKAEDLGYEYKTRPELEWYFLTPDYLPADTGGYMDLLPLDKYDYLRRVIVNDLLALGMGVKTIHHENGPGQQEFEFTPLDALRQADNVQTAKLAVKTESMLEGLIGSFMAKPFPDLAGSGLHIHQYLTEDGKNIFADESGEISEFLRYFVGGILEHVDAMTAILNPTTNSYKRLVPGHEAPVYKSWGVGNRTALLRVPGYEKDARVEYRACDGAANIYLASSLILAAGIDGVNHRIEPIPPTRENIEKMSQERRDDLGITKLPATLGEALDHLENSNFVRNVLGRQLVELFLIKKKEEYQEYLEAAALGDAEARAWELKTYLRGV